MVDDTTRWNFDQIDDDAFSYYNSMVYLCPRIFIYEDNDINIAAFSNLV